MDVNSTYCGGHFTTYTYKIPLCCIPATNNIVNQLYFNKDNEKKKN